MNDFTSIYLDNAATTSLDDRVLEAMLPFLRNHFGNPSSVHKHGREVRVAIEKARKTVASLLNATPGEIFFTSGGTEADNTAIHGAVEAYGLTQIISSPLEHHAVLHAAEVCANRRTIPLTLLNVDGTGNLDIEQLAKLLQENPKSLVTLMEGNNEIGNLTDLQVIGEVCKRFGAYFHSDTVQTVGHYHHDLKSLPVDAISGAAHKFHGPKGVGFLYVKKDRRITPYLYGGSQERNMRGGTENVPGIIGLAKALEIGYAEMEAHTAHIKRLKSHFIQRIKQLIPGVRFNGRSEELDQSLYTVVSISFPPSPSNQGMLLFNLDLNGVSASGGSACSSGAVLGSHVLQALNASPERESVRFSFSRYNTLEELNHTAEKLQELYT